MFSKFFIDRPIFATVLAIIMVLAGGVVLFTLPIAQYPDITPPTVMVMANYPGADAKTVAKAIGEPVEQAVNGVDGMLYMSSNSGSDGSYNLTITFENGTDVDQAAVEVQNRISQSDATLPSAVKQQGISVVKRSSSQLMFMILTSDNPERYNALYLTNYAQLNLTDPLSRVKGVGDVQAFGSGEYSMRIWLDPAKMKAYGLSPSDVQRAIEAQNMQVSAGTVGNPPNTTPNDFQFTLISQGELDNVEEFENIILRVEDTGVLRLKDVASIDLGSDSYSGIAKCNGESVAMIGVSQTPGANALETSKGVIAEMENLKQYFPEGIHYQVAMDTTTYVTKSIDEVLITFIETSLIVMVVILIFLQNWRAVIIPMITIPVSLIGTFVVMKILDFSLNTLTLFGLVLAIALVVDDAIVVVEDCSRLVDSGKLTRKEAATKAMKELTGPVIGEVLVLLSVFIPTAFVSGITGSLYKQFALTIATATAISGFNALTLTPSLCALFLNPRKDSNFFIYKWFNKGYDAVFKFYQNTIGKMLKHSTIAMLAFVAIAVVAIIGYLRWPTSYIPSEDMGHFMTAVQLPQGASLQRTDKYISEYAAKVKQIPGVKDVMAMSGFSFMEGGSGSNLGSLIVMLEPWGKRPGIDEIIAEADRIGMEMPGGICFSLNPPAIPGLGMTSGLQMQLLDINNLGAAEMMKAIEAIKRASKDNPDIAQITSNYQGEVPQYNIEIDRDRAQMLGVDLADAYSTLSGYMGSTFVNNFNKFGRSYEVTLEAEGNSKERVDQVMNLNVANTQGEMVPFSAFTNIKEVMGVSSVSRYNMYDTGSFTATPASGVGTSTAIQALEDLVDQTLGKNYSYAWTGEAYQETQAGTTIFTVLIMAIILTLLVLAAQYESWTDPIAVILSMPIAILGTIIGCIVMGQSVSIYTQIGLILLLGLSAKNAILIVEYAMDYRKAGVPLLKAAVDAGSVRFRPIMMTALAFVFGVMPMMFATGAGANSRIALGTAIVFGMALNAIIGTLFVPNFWKFTQTIQEKYFDKLFIDRTPAALAEAKAKQQSNSGGTKTGGNIPPSTGPDVEDVDGI